MVRSENFHSDPDHDHYSNSSDEVLLIKVDNNFVSFAFTVRHMQQVGYHLHCLSCLEHLVG